MGARSSSLATRTGISGQDQLKARWVARVHLTASKSDHARLQRRTKRLDDGRVELRRLLD
jgi:hypothetical protein